MNSSVTNNKLLIDKLNEATDILDSFRLENSYIPNSPDKNFIDSIMGLNSNWDKTGTLATEIIGTLEQIDNTIIREELNNATPYINNVKKLAAGIGILDNMFNVWDASNDVTKVCDGSQAIVTSESCDRSIQLANQFSKLSYVAGDIGTIFTPGGWVVKGSTTLGWTFGEDNIKGALRDVSQKYMFKEGALVGRYEVENKLINVNREFNEKIDTIDAIRQDYKNLTNELKAEVNEINELKEYDKESNNRYIDEKSTNLKEIRVDIINLERKEQLLKRDLFKLEKEKEDLQKIIVRYEDLQQNKEQYKEDLERLNKEVAESEERLPHFDKNAIEPGKRAAIETIKYKLFQLDVYEGKVVVIKDIIPALYKSKDVSLKIEHLHSKKTELTAKFKESGSCDEEIEDQLVKSITAYNQAVSEAEKIIGIINNILPSTRESFEKEIKDLKNQLPLQPETMTDRDYWIRNYEIILQIRGLENAQAAADNSIEQMKLTTEAVADVMGQQNRDMAIGVALEQQAQISTELDENVDVENGSLLESNLDEFSLIPDESFGLIDQISDYIDFAIEDFRGDISDTVEDETAEEQGEIDKTGLPDEEFPEILDGKPGINDFDLITTGKGDDQLPPEIVGTSGTTDESGQEEGSPGEAEGLEPFTLDEGVVSGQPHEEGSGPGDDQLPPETVGTSGATDDSGQEENSSGEAEGLEPITLDEGVVSGQPQEEGSGPGDDQLPPETARPSGTTDDSGQEEGSSGEAEGLEPITLDQGVVSGQPQEEGSGPGDDQLPPETVGTSGATDGSDREEGPSGEAEGLEPITLDEGVVSGQPGEEWAGRGDDQITPPEPGSTEEAINTENQPKTLEELRARLQELGLSQSEASALINELEGLDPTEEAVVPAGEPVPEEGLVEAEQPNADKGGIFGLTEKEWESLNNRMQGVETAEQAGEDMAALVAAYETGDDWEIFESSMDILRSVDSLLVDRFDEYPDILKSQSSNIQGSSHLVNVVGSWKDLQDAIENGDDWAAAESATELMESGFDSYNAFNGIESNVYNQEQLDDIEFSAQGGKVAGAASAVVSFAVSVRDLVDALEEGDTIEVLDAALQVTENGASAYVATAEAYAAITGNAASGSVNALSSSMATIGTAVGIAQGFLSIADGDVEGGSEQIALTTATYALSTIPVYGWIAALALQLGSATRGCDGRLIDKENIEEFADDLGPAGEEAVKTAIASVELPSELAAEAYEGTSYLSGFDLEMYDDIGVEIPDEMHAEFAFNQTVFDAANPLRYAEYFTDLEELSLSDLWDSTYITQTIAAAVEQIENSPKFILSTITDTPALVADLVEASFSPSNLVSLIKGFFGSDDPPSATAGFSIDESGNVVMDVSGDSSMRESAAAHGSPMIELMEGYRQNGGRLLIDGSLPSLTVVSGEESQINYRSSTGGSVSVLVDDMSTAPIRMQGVLYARDRGERLDSAVQLGTNSSGDIDVTKVDSIMAGYGFGKDGITYTYGEATERHGATTGTGLFNIGGNTGPEGLLFTAKPGDITSLPLRPEQLPSQSIGRISRVVGLNTMFSGSGSELLATALALPGGLLSLASTGETAEAGESNIAYQYDYDYQKPLDAIEPEKYPQRKTDAYPEKESIEGFAQQETTPFSFDRTEHVTENPPDHPVQAYLLEESVDAVYPVGARDTETQLPAPEPAVMEESRENSETVVLGAVQTGTVPETIEVVAAEGKEVASDIGSVVEAEAEPSASLPPAEQPPGPVFFMAEKTVLRFLPTQLIENATPGQYFTAGEKYIFLGFGGAENGKVWQEENGDIRFEPRQGFVGSGSFNYRLQRPSGEVVERTATVLVENVNDDPLLQADSFSLQEGEAFYLDNLLANDTDPEGDILQFDHFHGLDHGEISIVDNRLVFVPEAGYFGDEEFYYWARDNSANYPVAARAVLHYDDVNNGVVTGDDRFIVVEGHSLQTTVDKLLANDLEYDNESIIFNGLGDAVHGTATLEADGTVVFSPDPDYSGTDGGFYYNVEDQSGNVSTGWAGVEILDTREAPVARNRQTHAILDDETLSPSPGETEGFVRDPESDLPGLDILSNELGGGVTLEGGNNNFIPGPGFEEEPVLNVTDPDASSQDIFMLPEITGLASVEEQSLSTSIEELLTLLPDAEEDGPLEFVGLGAASHGEVLLGAGGMVEFIPEKDYFGEDAGFFCTVRDANGIEGSFRVTVQVENVNDIPQITADRVSIREDETLLFSPDELEKFILDPDGDSLTLAGIDTVAGGSIEVRDGHYTFVPDADYYGEASLSYVVQDEAGETVTGELSLGILPVNDMPVGGNISASGIEDNELLFHVEELLRGATDPEDGGGSEKDLCFGGIDSSVNGAVYVDAENIVHFIPHADFYGQAGFRYRVLDSEGGVGLGSVALAIAGVDDDPVAMDDGGILAWSNNSHENIYRAETFLANDYDADGDTLTIASVGEAEFGTVFLDNLGNIHYIAESGWVGVDSFTYTVTDGNNTFSEATAEIDVKLNSSPVLFSEVLYSGEDIVVPIEQQMLLANDYDPNGDTLRITAVDDAKHCWVELTDDGTIVFVPEPHYNNLCSGRASFRYTVSDGIGEGVSALAVMDIEPENDKPIPVDDSISGAFEDNSFRLYVSELLFNDTDVEMASPHEEDSISFNGAWGAQHGNLFYNALDDSIIYTPDKDFSGIDTFQYVVVDSHGEEAVADARIHVAPLNDSPYVQADIGSPAEDSIWNYYSIAEMVANDIDPDGDSLTIVNPYVIDGRADVRISGGNLAVKPRHGEDNLVIGYTVSDGRGGTNTGSLTIDRIIEHNYAPTFSGLYSIGWKNNHTVWFNFHAEDRNGGNTWGPDHGDIVSISASAPNTGRVTQLADSYTFKFKGEVQNAALVLTAVDHGGATGSIYVRLSELSRIDGQYHYSPVVLDLDGDGVELLNVSEGVGFDWNLDGTAEATGWVGKDDGFLVYDHDHDRTVTYADELALKEYNPEATTDLEGLRIFDTNRDGIFGVEDEEWNGFGVWQDSNSNGITDEGEFTSLAEAGIASVNLSSDNNFHEVDGNVVYGETTFIKEDGTEGIVGDVGLNGESIELTQTDQPQPGELIVSIGTEPANTSGTGVADQLLPAEAMVTVDSTIPSPATTEEIPIVVDSQSTILQQEEVPVAPDEKEQVADDLILSVAELNRQFEQLKSDMAICNDPDNQPCDTYPVAPAPSFEIIDQVSEEQDCLLFG